MISSFAQLVEQVRNRPRKHVVIAAAQEDELRLAQAAIERGIANFTLIGDRQELEKLMQASSFAAGTVLIIDEQSHEAAARKAVEMVTSGQADIPMKGLLHTGTFLKAVLDKTAGLASRQRISQITIFEGVNDGLQLLTDCAINIKPSLEEKIAIINNAVFLAQQLGFQMPRVALLGAVETVIESMPDTLESAVLTQMNRRGQIKGCLIDGPLSLDTAICPEAAARKGIDSPVAGKADILVASELREANTLSKSLHYYANRSTASVIIGTRSPIIMTSRTDDFYNKLNSIAAACMLR